MYILEIKQSKLGSIEQAVVCSMDYIEDENGDALDKYFEFLNGFRGQFGDVPNMNYDTYNQYNIPCDKIIELGYESVSTLEEWIERVEGLCNEDGIRDAAMFTMHNASDVVKEMRAFCNKHKT